ncbi:MAG TPA: GMC family oxidoreductase N-terminal domain-containing protein, partial [Ilumatobacteraceae bacterium]
DYDEWAALGNPLWSWERVLPAFIRLESDLDFPDAPYHGSGGPMPVKRAMPPDLHPLSQAFVSACAQLGHPQMLDKNAPRATGCGPLPRNVVEGVRVNAALAYITPHRQRANLVIESEVTARRVLFDGSRATGVEVARAGNIEVFTGDEIVLSAGAVMSPHLLLISGLGPADDLRRVGVEPRVDLPGVGTRCRDHPQLFVGFESSTTLPTNDLSGVVEVALDATIDGAPVALMPYLASMADLVPGSGASPAELVIGMLLERAEGAAEISIVSPDPQTPPAIDYHSLEHGADRRRLDELIGLGSAIVDSQSMRELGVRRTSPAPGVDADEWLNANITTAIHLCSSAPMGPDADVMAVVDQQCRVRGVERLRVVDTSVLPTAPSRGPACTAVLIGERAAAFFD